MDVFPPPQTLNPARRWSFWGLVFEDFSLARSHTPNLCFHQLLNPDCISRLVSLKLPQMASINEVAASPGTNNQSRAVKDLEKPRSTPEVTERLCDMNVPARRRIKRSYCQHMHLQDLAWKSRIRLPHTLWKPLGW